MDAPPPLAARLGAYLLVALLGALAYANGLEGEFVFDDLFSIRDNPNVRSLSPLSEALWGPAGSGSNARPLVALSLAVNYALGELDVTGYRLFNVAAHVATALTLLAVLSLALRARLGTKRAEVTAWVSAMLFVAHPLASNAIQHVVYRSEVLMGLFFLLAHWAALRGFGSARAKRWFVLAGACGLAAVLSKEAAAFLPLSVLLCDRALSSGTLREAWRRHGLLHGLLFATWILLALLIAFGERGSAVSLFHDALGPLDYLRTQAGVVLHYLRLVFVPYPLVLDYEGWPVAERFMQYGPQGALLLALLGVSAWGVVRKKPGALLALAFFGVLAPSSSVVPIGGMIAAEHRMYLPLALVLALVALLAERLTRRLPAAVPVGAGLLAAAGLAVLTHARNEDHRTAVSIYEDTVAKRPDNYRAWSSLGVAYKERAERTSSQADLAAAEAAYRESLRLHPGYAKNLSNLGNLLLVTGRGAEALPFLEEAARRDEEQVELALNLAEGYRLNGRAREALPHYERVVRAWPTHAGVRFSYGLAAEQAGERALAVAQYEEALKLQPGWPAPLARLRELGAR